MWHETFRDFTSYIYSVAEYIYLTVVLFFFCSTKMTDHVVNELWVLPLLPFAHAPLCSLCSVFSVQLFFLFFSLHSSLTRAVQFHSLILPPLHLKCRTEFSFLTRVRWRQIVNFSLTEQFRYQLLWMIYAINLCVYVLLSLLLYSQFISIQWVHYIVGHTSRFRCVEGDRRKFSHILPLNGMIFKGQLVWWERVIVTHVIIVVVAIDGNSLRLITFVLLFDIILSSFSSQPERKMKLNPVNLPKTTSTHT